MHCSVSIRLNGLSPKSINQMQLITTQHKISFLIHILIHDLRFGVKQKFCFVLNKVIALRLLKFFFILLCNLNKSGEFFFRKFQEFIIKSACK